MKPEDILLDVSDCTHEEILDLRADTQLDADQIKIQLDQANNDLKERGVKSDYGWLLRAKTALKIKRMQVQQLSMDAAKLRKVESANINRTFGSNFIQAAKQLLSEDMFKDIVELAREMS